MHGHEDGNVTKDVDTDEAGYVFAQYYFCKKVLRNVIVYRPVNRTGKTKRGDIQWVALGKGRYATMFTAKKQRV